MPIACISQITAQKPTKDVFQILNLETIKKLNLNFKRLCIFSILSETWYLRNGEPSAKCYFVFLDDNYLAIPIVQHFFFQNNVNYFLNLSIMLIHPWDSKLSVTGCSERSAPWDTKLSVTGCSERSVPQHLTFTSFCTRGLSVVMPRGTIWVARMR
jgi:hypothetical protein